MSEDDYIHPKGSGRLERVKPLKELGMQFEKINEVYKTIRDLGREMHPPGGKLPDDLKRDFRTL